MQRSLTHALVDNFLGNSPYWYKLTIIFFLIANPMVLWSLGPAVAGWLLVGEFIFTLAMALKCYPLQPGGLLVLQAILLQLTTPQALYKELAHNFPVILLLMFMVAGIYFMKGLLLFLFSRLLLGVRSKPLLALLCMICGAIVTGVVAVALKKLRVKKSDEVTLAKAA